MQTLEDSRWHQLMGALFALLVAGVVGGVATYASVQSLDMNVHLFREEVRREFDWYQAQIQRVQLQLENHITEHQREHNQ